MAKKAKVLKSQMKAKYMTRAHNRCQLCGRPKAYNRLFGMCRLCLREQVYKGNLPGVTKASW